MFFLNANVYNAKLQVITLIVYRDFIVNELNGLHQFQFPIVSITIVFSLL